MPSTDYDIAIVGSGFGGASAAFALSNAGFKTLLIERGGWTARDETDWNARKILIEKRYRGTIPVSIQQYDRSYKDEYLDEVVGGMSVFFGGATLRLRENDFAAWPISYADLEPYYTQAERMLEVHGQAEGDPYAPPRTSDYPFAAVELTRPARRIYRTAEKLGYRPFGLPMAINYRNVSRTTCISCFTCDGFPCKIEAKNDVTATALNKADMSHLKLIPNAIAHRLVVQDGRIRAIEWIDKETKQRIESTAKVFIVSAGALQSPALLIRSGLERHDRSQTLGRFLMRHCNAVVGCLFPFRINPDRVNHKQVCITHFYEDMRDELNTAVGIIQDACTPPPEAVKYLVPKGLGYIASFFSSYIQSLICIAEDLPQQENRVCLDSKKDSFGLPLVRVHHRYCKSDHLRLNYLVARAKKILRKAGGLVRKTTGIDTFSHAVGTVRFGRSADMACLDPFCRFFGLRNLFVVDGSFMPTSGGVNPSLTIAANALRVSDAIKNNFGEVTST